MILNRCKIKNKTQSKKIFYGDPKIITAQHHSIFYLEGDRVCPLKIFTHTTLKERTIGIACGPRYTHLV